MFGVKKVKGIVRLALVLTVVAGALAGCGTIPLNEHESWGNKVWRMGVIDPHFHAVSGPLSKPRGVPDYVSRMRVARVFMASPGLFDGLIMAQTVLVPDQIPALQKGDVVDVYLPDPPELTWKHHNWYHIIRLVCRANDKACKAREEKKYGRLGGIQIKDEPPLPKFTYNDRVN